MGLAKGGSLYGLDGGDRPQSEPGVSGNPPKIGKVGKLKTKIKPGNCLKCSTMKSDETRADEIIQNWVLRAKAGVMAQEGVRAQAGVRVQAGAVAAGALRLGTKPLSP